MAWAEQVCNMVTRDVMLRVGRAAAACSCSHRRVALSQHWHGCARWHVLLRCVIVCDLSSSRTKQRRHLQRGKRGGKRYEGTR